MTVNDYINVSEVALNKDYRYAQDGVGFVVPGLPLVASISPSQPINYVAILHYVADEPRAKHYHKVKLEYLVILNGRLKAEFYLPDNIDDSIEMILEAGSILEIKPGCAHIFTAIDGEASVLEMSPQKLDLSDQISV